MKLETKRLTLRPWREEEAPRLYQLCRDPEIGPPAGWPAHTSVEHSRAVLRDILMAEGTFAVTRRGEDLPIGCVGWKNTGADPALHELEIGYWMGQAYWGHGYIPEAVETLLRYCFTALDQRRIWCAHFDSNEKSRRVIEKCGFVRQFSRIDEVKALGERRLTHYYALTQAEWKERHPAVRLGDTVSVRIDRPVGSVHPDHPELVYPVNYGYVPGCFAPDGEEQDVYVLGVSEPLETFSGPLVAILRRMDDPEDKWVAAPEGMRFSAEEIAAQTAFQERWFRTEIVMKKDEEGR